jgi:hypothetical protein
MNERIRLLAEQAGYKHPDAVGMCEDYSYFNHEKFAELIVRECADQFRLVYTDEQYQRRIDKTILKHFGLYE